MRSHFESSDSASIMSSSTIAPSDYTAGSSTTTFVLESPPKDSEKSSKSKDKKDKKSRKDDKPRSRTLCPPMIFA